MLFGQFIGVWDMEIEFFDDTDRRIYHELGEWAFGWVLDGRAIQDVLTFPNTDAAAGEATAPGIRGIGTSLRLYDARSDTWKVIWLGAVSGTTVMLEGGTVEDEIHLNGMENNGTANWWMFTDISADRFTWKGFERPNPEASWRLVQHMHGTRRPLATG